MKKIVPFGLMLLCAAGCNTPAPNATADAVTTAEKPASVPVAPPAENKAVISPEIHKANVDFLKEKFSADSKLTDAEKEDLVTCLEEQYRRPVILSEPRYNGKVVYVVQIANNTNLTMVQKKAAIKARFKDGNKASGTF